MILDAIRLSLANLFAPETRGVFWKVLGLTLLALVVVWFGLRESFIAFSVGIAIYPEDGADPETLVKNADIAMYEAKYSGKNAYRFCSPSMKQLVSKKSRIRSELNHAIARGELLLHYQPIIDPATSRITGFEALLRWNMNHEGLINPEEFIPLAEEKNDEKNDEKKKRKHK